MEIEIRFPMPERLVRGGSKYAHTSGIWMFDSSGVVEIMSMTGKGERSESVRLVVPFSHVRALRDALDLMDANLTEQEIEKDALASHTRMSEATDETFAHTPSMCPSKHWNRGDDICADCGAFLG